METKLSPREPQEDLFVKNYEPPSRDITALPDHVVYVLLATAVVFLALYAIVRNLILDLTHDLADWLFGEQPPEVMLNPCECRAKFRADWSPQTVMGLEELARVEQIQVLTEGSRGLPAIWVIPDYEPLPPRTGPRVAFGKVI